MEDIMDLTAWGDSIIGLYETPASLEMINNYLQRWLFLLVH